MSVVIEPYLVQLNFIARTSQGRVITDLGRRISRATIALPVVRKTYYSDVREDSALDKVREADNSPESLQ